MHFDHLKFVFHTLMHTLAFFGPYQHLVLQSSEQKCEGCNLKSASTTPLLPTQLSPYLPNCRKHSQTLEHLYGWMFVKPYGDGKSRYFKVNDSPETFWAVGAGSPIGQMDVYPILSLKYINHRICAHPLHDTTIFTDNRKFCDHGFYLLWFGVKLVKSLSFQSEWSVNLFTRCCL